MISVIIATKNGEKYIERAINSALKQTVSKDTARFPGFEIVVISDGSTDDTVQIVKTSFPKTVFPYIRLIELTENVGPGLARHKAIESSSNPYIAILDDDDEWTNDKKLENQVTFLEQHPNVLVVGAARTEFVNERGAHMIWYVNKTDPTEIKRNILSRNPLVNSSVLFRKSAYEKAGGFKDMRLSEDYDLWLRMGLIGDIANIPDADTKYTFRTQSTSGSNGKQAAKLARISLRQIREYRGKYPGYPKAVIKGYLRMIATTILSKIL